MGVFCCRPRVELLSSARFHLWPFYLKKLSFATYHFELMLGGLCIVIASFAVTEPTNAYTTVCEMPAS